MGFIEGFQRGRARAYDERGERPRRLRDPLPWPEPEPPRAEPWGGPVGDAWPPPEPAHLAELQARLDAKTALAADLADYAEDCEARAGALEAELTDLVAYAEQCDARAAATLQTKLTDLADYAEDCEARASALEAELTDLVAYAEQCDARAAATLQTKLTDLADYAEQCEARAGTLLVELTQAQACIAELEAAPDALDEILESAFGRRLLIKALHPEAHAQASDEQRRALTGWAKLVNARIDAQRKNRREAA